MAANDKLVLLLLLLLLLAPSQMVIVVVRALFAAYTRNMWVSPARSRYFRQTELTVWFPLERMPQGRAV